MTGTMLDEFEALEGVRERFAPRKQLRATLYGETTLCEDERTATKQLVVLKRVSLALLRANATHARENPARERDVIDALRKNGGHAHVVAYAEPQALFVHDENLYIVMEYCAGGDLYDFVCQKPQSRLHEIEALRYFSQIANGLAFLHDHGIAHRDLSLENVLLQDGGVAKICDFGLSTDASVRCNDVVGKLYYMAPEVVQCGDDTELDYNPKAADVWSLGILLFILLTGSPLISDETPGGREATLKVLQKSGGLAKILAMWDLQKLMAPSTVELLTVMLQVEPCSRVDVHQVLDHPALSAFRKA